LVAHKFLDDIELSDHYKNQAVLMCKNFHQTSIQLSKKYFDQLQRINYVTPTSFLELIKTFKDLLEKKRFEILSLKERYSFGAEKLESSEKSISIMQKMLHALQPKMIKTSIETEDLINGLIIFF
jgi:dynein heavy chain